ncbi:MAG: GGDEF domain-containing protein [Lachnospiraceae bacterium]|nr:GGDEF domain-containing protein [Lachnospiraceae bacterium]
MGNFDPKKMTYVVNTVILLLVLGLMAFFCMLNAPFLVYFSIPTIAVYLIGYFLVYKNYLQAYVRMVYMWITIYMCLTTLFLGYAYGFHLYCFSMIPVLFITKYFAYRLGNKSLGAFRVSFVIAGLYLLCTGYVALFGPIYDRNQKYAAIFWILNALIVFGFLIFYSHYMINMVIESQQRLIEMAQVDQLTKLYNRHYMKGRLKELAKAKHAFLAMADVDDFKKINDTYGHNAGDDVLKAVSELMKQVCKGCEIARWGGEEFLIVTNENIITDGIITSDIIIKLLEELRAQVEAHPITVDDQLIKMTVTIGLTEHQEGQRVDDWVNAADEKLYQGKHQGKNQLIY